MLVLSAHFWLKPQLQTFAPSRNHEVVNYARSALKKEGDYVEKWHTVVFIIELYPHKMFNLLFLFQTAMYIKYDPGSCWSYFEWAFTTQKYDLITTFMRYT